MLCHPFALLGYIPFIMLLFLNLSVFFLKWAEPLTPGIKYALVSEGWNRNRLCLINWSRERVRRMINFLFETAGLNISHISSFTIAKSEHLNKNGAKEVCFNLRNLKCNPPFWDWGGHIIRARSIWQNGIITICTAAWNNGHGRHPRAFSLSVSFNNKIESAEYLPEPKALSYLLQFPPNFLHRCTFWPWS